MTNYEVLGAVKVKDGVFIGDELAAQDLEFVVANKVTHVINCSGKQVPNHWEPIGVVYLTYYWADNDSQIILDSKDVVSNEIFNFIDECIVHAESVLIHSVRGQSRSGAVLAAYMMRKYSWTLRKTMEFLMGRRPDLNLKPAFLQQLAGYERRIQGASKLRLSSDWNEVPPAALKNPLETEEFMLRNTYLNSQMGQSDFTPYAGKEPTTTTLAWADNGREDVVDKSRLENVVDNGNGRSQLNKRAASGDVQKGILKKRKRQSPQDKKAQGAPRLGASRDSGDLREASRDGDILRSGSRGDVRDADPEPDARDSRAPKECWGEEVNVMERREIQKPINAWGEVPSNTTPHRLPRDSLMNHEMRDPRDPMRDGREVMRDSRDPRRDSREPPLRDSRDASLRDSRDMRDSRDGSLRDSRDMPRRDSRDSSRDALRDSQRDMRDGRDRGRDGSSQRLSSPLHKDNGRISVDMPGRFFTKRREPSPSDQRTGYRPESPLRLHKSQPSSSRTQGTAPRFGPSAMSLGRSSSGMSSGDGSNAMGAYRQGPVRAKMDVLSATDLSVGRDRQRPQTATVSSGSSGNNNRPASPLGICRDGSSRRPGSPMRMVNIGNVVPKSNVYPQSLDKQQRTLSSHMRRAPSPTPAFNRPNSPNKPRWRM